MSTARVYIHPTCSTCRKALAWLKDHGHQVEVIEIATTPPPRSELAQALAQLGSRQRLFNTSGLSYRALGAARVRALADDEALDLLAADGKLIRRPFLVCSDGRITTGFSPEAWQECLGEAAPG